MRSLPEFLSDLESAGDLLRVRAPVDPNLEIAEITRRVIRRDGPALLFESVRGHDMPVVTNLLGSPRRIARALGVSDIEEAAGKIGRLVHLKPPAGIVGAIRDLGGTLQTLEILRSLAPKRVRSAPCQEVIEEKVDLDRLPILTGAAGDAGRT
ncbi:Carboxylyase-related protein, partial [mine drainage metagenome]